VSVVFVYSEHLEYLLKENAMQTLSGALFAVRNVSVICVCSLLLSCGASSQNAKSEFARNEGVAAKSSYGEPAFGMQTSAAPSVASAYSAPTVASATTAPGFAKSAAAAPASIGNGSGGANADSGFVAGGSSNSGARAGSGTSVTSCNLQSSMNAYLAALKKVSAEAAAKLADSAQWKQMADANNSEQACRIAKSLDCLTPLMVRMHEASSTELSEISKQAQACGMAI